MLHRSVWTPGVQAQLSCVLKFGSHPGWHPGHLSHLKAGLGKDPFLSSLVWWLAGLSLMGYWTEISLSSLPWRASPGGISLHGCWLPQCMRRQYRPAGWALAMEKHSLLEANHSATTYHICHVLLVRSKCSQEGITQGRV